MNSVVQTKWPRWQARSVSTSTSVPVEGPQTVPVPPALCHKLHSHKPALIPASMCQCSLLQLHAPLSCWLEGWCPPLHPRQAQPSHSIRPWAPPAALSYLLPRVSTSLQWAQNWKHVPGVGCVGQADALSWHGASVLNSFGFLAAVAHCRLVYNVLLAIAPQSPPAYF